MDPYRRSYPLPPDLFEPGSIVIVGNAATYIPPRPSREEVPARRASVAGLLSAREVARRLGVGRSSTLPRLVAAGLLFPVPRGAGRGFRAVDVERLIENGYRLPAKDRKSARVRVPRPTKSNPPTVKRILDLPY